jgi:predicted HicB family RNase H-like nuclease
MNKAVSTQDSTAGRQQVRLDDDIHLAIAIHAKKKRTTMKKIVDEACRIYLATTEEGVSV